MEKTPVPFAGAILWPMISNKKKVSRILRCVRTSPHSRRLEGHREKNAEKIGENGEKSGANVEKVKNGEESGANVEKVNNGEKSRDGGEKFDMDTKS
jgi:hypothetical protein